MAWLNARPKPPEGSRRAAIKGAAELPTRAEAMKRGRKNFELPMPPNPAPYILQRLVEVGLSEAAGMGVAAISWSTIMAWARLTGIPLEPWEARLLRTLSIEYVAFSRKAESEACPQPWRAPTSADDREAAQAALERVLG